VKKSEWLIIREIINAMVHRKCLMYHSWTMHINLSKEIEMWERRIKTYENLLINEYEE